MVFENIEQKGIALMERIRTFTARHELEQQKEASRKEFLTEIEKARRDLETARNNYNFAKEPALLEYYIYEIKAAETRLNYYVRLAKKEKLTNEHCFAHMPSVRRNREELT